MVTLKLSDEVLASMGLGPEATPEEAEKSIKDTLATLKESTAMNELTIEVVDKLSKRVEALEGQVSNVLKELPKDFEASIRTVAETVAKATAAQEVSMAIAKAGSVQATPAPQPEDTAAPTIRQQFAAIKDSTERGVFWRKHSEELLKTL